MDKRLANDIRNKLQAERIHMQWDRLNNMQAYSGRWVNIIVGNDEYMVMPFMSYDTIVGFILYNDFIFYEVGKYSKTTSQQVTRLCKTNSFITGRQYFDRVA